jgi:hypothetical protein
MVVENKACTSIAWFSLWSLLKKGDQQRALSMQRLLMHTFNNEAFSTLVEAELLAAIGSPVATTMLYRAASMYTKQQDLEIACSLYERLVLREPNEPLYQTQLTNTINALKHPERLHFFRKNHLQAINRCAHSTKADEYRTHL